MNSVSALELAAATANGDTSSDERWKLQVTIGHERQHAGGWTGQRLANQMRNILLEKCPDKFGRHVCDAAAYGWGPVGYTNVQKCGITKTFRGFYRDDAELVLEVYSHLFPENAPGLRDLLINHVAEVFGATTDLKVNQYEVSLKNAGCNSCGCIEKTWNRFANAPDRVEVSLSAPPYEDLDNSPHLFVRSTSTRTNWRASSTA